MLAEGWRRVESGVTASGHLEARSFDNDFADFRMVDGDEVPARCELRVGNHFRRVAHPMRGHTRCLQGFQSTGMKRVTLEVTANNAAAVELYRDLGFRNVRTLFRQIDLDYVTPL